MSERIKRSFRWMLLLLICAFGVSTFTGCVVDRDHGHDDHHDFHDDHHDFHDDHH